MTGSSTAITSSDLLHAARRARCDARGGPPLQDHPGAGRDGPPVRGIHEYRQIHTDGRPLPVDPNPTWYGYSVGRWEGETFVVDTAGFKEGTWLDNQGHPHTDALRTTERFRRINFGSMALDVTIDDPKAYSRPWTSVTIPLFLQPDTELLEHLCENNRDAARLTAPPPIGGR